MSTSPFLPADDPRAGTCATCGAPFAADQRYCLSCGARRTHARLPFQDALVQTTPVGPAGHAGVPPALWAAPPTTGPSAQTMLAALACVLLAFGLGFLVAGGNDDPQQPIVLGAGAPAAAAAPTATTPEEEVEEDASASAGDDEEEEEADASDTDVSEPEPAKNLNAEEKKEAAELKKIPATVPKAKPLSDAASKALDSKDPDKAREASNSLPDVVSTGD
ncbi:hypothetical protein [Patulibacter americanus]|uniref:hypothetical protein n=1 Tax=Patulibacter americanus TaxID=588672 RepID=UPI0003B562E1|nr:hypothetical protein [Patulibacter americanus]